MHIYNSTPKSPNTPRSRSCGKFATNYILKHYDLRLYYNNKKYTFGVDL
jgi:hypothetical protein